ncbi:hypothetical protein [Flavobacterium sp. N1736]|uniref:hypothetical protein n=1 Tax=Flavobacterium sp. N1736 TaxID=2986823 RepID=UPI0022257C30|nr:hypothetical protein [Flavobacterium sp. N1736]
MENLKRKAKRSSLLLSLLYVGLGTIAVLCSYPPFYGDWVLVVLLITFPVSILSFGILIAGKYYTAVIIVQLITFVVFWYLCYKFLLKKYNKESKVQLSNDDNSKEI